MYLYPLGLKQAHKLSFYHKNYYDVESGSEITPWTTSGLQILVTS